MFYLGPTVADQLEFDSWPEKQKKLARKVLLNSREILYAVQDHESLPPISPRESTLDNPN